MKVLKREDVQTKHLPGRAVQMVVGKEEAASPSTDMTMGRPLERRNGGELTSINKRKGCWAMLPRS